MQFPENQVSRTDSFTLNVNRLPRISTLSYYPSEARKGRCFRFGHQPNTNVEVSQDAEFRTKLWKVPCNILPSYADKFVSGNSDLSSVNKYRGQMPEQHIRKINKKMGKVSYEVRRRQQEQTQQMLFLTKPRLNRKHHQKSCQSNFSKFTILHVVAYGTARRGLNWQCN